MMVAARGSGTPGTLTTPPRPLIPALNQTPAGALPALLPPTSPSARSPSRCARPRDATVSRRPAQPDSAARRSPGHTLDSTRRASRRATTSRRRMPRQPRPPGATPDSPGSRVALKENIRVEGKRDIQTKVMTTLFALLAEVERA